VSKRTKRAKAQDTGSAADGVQQYEVDFGRGDHAGGNKFVLLNDLCDMVNKHAHEKALAEYLLSARHQLFELAEEWRGILRRQTLDLKKRKVLPYLRISPAEETFIDMLRTCPGTEFVRCMPNYGDPITEDGDDYGRELVRVDSVEGLTLDELRRHLLDDHACGNVNASVACTADEACQLKYYRAVLAYFEAAADCALAVGSSSVRAFLNARRLMEPVADRAGAADKDPMLWLSEENLRAAYAAAQTAQADLWIDVRLATGRKKSKRGGGV